MTYTVLSGKYTEGKVMRIEGTQGGPDDVGNPNTGYSDLDPTADTDPVVYSYMSTDGNGVEEPHILLVRTNATDQTKTTYTVLHQDPKNPDAWVPFNNREKIQLLYGTDPIGNPQSLAQVKTENGRFIYLVDYDSTVVYGIDVNNFENVATDPTYDIDTTLCADVVSKIAPPDGLLSHGVSVVALQDGNSGHSLFVLYTTADNPWSAEGYYEPSTVVKLSVATNGTPTVGNSVTVGRNATGIVPVSTTSNGIVLLVPAIGGKQNYGYNNADESKLSLVSTVNFSQGYVRDALVGVYADPVTTMSMYDIRMVAASSKGDDIYLLTGTFSPVYDLYWRLYKFSITELDGWSDQPLSAIGAYKVDEAPNALGYYWSVLYENVPRYTIDSVAYSGRLWFLRGSPIQITPGTDYPNPVPSPLPPDPPVANFKYFDIGYVDGTIGGMNVNSVDLTGEMVAQAKTDKSISTIFRAYQPPHVTSGAFRSMADFIRYENIRKRHQERLEKERAKGRRCKPGASKDAASKVVTLQPKDITLAPKVTVPKLTVSIDPKVLAAKIDVTVSIDPKDATPKIEITAAK
jgi:hypothetical protein